MVQRGYSYLPAALRRSYGFSAVFLFASRLMDTMLPILGVKHICYAS